MNEENFGLETALDELKNHHERTMNGVDTIRETARTIMGAASIGLPLVSAARLLAPNQGFVPADLRAPVMAIVALGYLVLMGLCLYVVGPTAVYGPLRTTREDIDQLIGKPKDAVQQAMLEQYLTISTLNQLVTIDLSRKTRLAGIILVLDTALLLGLL